ncbi:hypothetical protein OUZ56_005702 [Daphnia magna]|uniref:Uncharacterized protein n=1 Tax=Daphnia magna TaxID=35525 RepID=A0ABQ9YTI1_9CRUS|nr:hypothetical protein OUZ56_005702 [Daphnia magna]
MIHFGFQCQYHLNYDEPDYQYPSFCRILFLNIIYTRLSYGITTDTNCQPQKEQEEDVLDPILPKGKKRLLYRTVFQPRRLNLVSTSKVKYLNWPTLPMEEGTWAYLRLTGHVMLLRALLGLPASRLAVGPSRPPADGHWRSLPRDRAPSITIAAGKSVAYLGVNGCYGEDTIASISFDQQERGGLSTLKENGRAFGSRTALETLRA